MTQPDLSSLALPDSPARLPDEIEEALKTLRYAEFSYGFEIGRNPSQPQDTATAGVSSAFQSLRSVIAKHLLTAEEAKVFVERADADLQDRQPAPYAWAYRSTFESGLAKLRLLSGSSRGEE